METKSCAASAEDEEAQREDDEDGYRSLFQYIESNEILFQVDDSSLKKATACFSHQQCFHPNYYATQELFEKSTKRNFNDQRLQVLLDEEVSSLKLLRDRCIFLCNEECYCHKNKLQCKNSLEALQNLSAVGKVKVFKPKNFQQKGYGLQAVVPILKGTFVVEYVGEVKRIPKNKEQSNDGEEVTVGNETSAASSSTLSPEYSFLLSVNYKGDEVVVDAGTRANLGRFVNHSCNPNLIYFYVYKKYLTLPAGVAYFAARDIAAGEELTVDYDDLHSFDHCYCEEQCCKNPPPTLVEHAPEPPMKRRRTTYEHESKNTC